MRRLAERPNQPSNGTSSPGSVGAARSTPRAAQRCAAGAGVDGGASDRSTMDHAVNQSERFHRSRQPITAAATPQIYTYLQDATSVATGPLLRITVSAGRRVYWRETCVQMRGCASGEQPFAPSPHRSREVTGPRPTQSLRRGIREDYGQLRRVEIDDYPGNPDSNPGTGGRPSIAGRRGYDGPNVRRIWVANCAIPRDVRFGR